MELPMDCIAFILWMTIVYLNVSIAMNKSRSFTFWFVLSLISGPFASIILMFYLQDKIDFVKTGNLYEQIKYIESKTKFKLFTWKNYTSNIDELNYDFEDKELLRLKCFLEADIESRNLILTLTSIVSSIAITFSVGMSVYKFTVLDNNRDIANAGDYQIIYYVLCVIMIVLIVIVIIIVSIQTNRKHLLSILNYIEATKNI